MLSAAITIGIVLACLYCWRFMFRLFLNMDRYGKIEGIDVALSGLMATISFWAAPAIIPFVALKYVLDARSDGEADWERFADLLAGRTRAQKMADRKRALDEREAHIRRLERELGVASTNDRW